jgi:thiol-disulfide isomerase/thioredoxin
MALILFAITALPEPAIAASFQWLDAKHRLHSLDEYRGQPLILHLWASWCPPCRQELPSLAAWQHAHSGVVVLPVSVDESSADAVDFLRARHIDLPLLLSDPDQAAALGVRVLPTSFLIDAHGTIRARLVGAQPWRDAKFSAAILDKLSSYAPLSAER